MICEGNCGLELPDRIVFKCAGHCEKNLCVRCIKPHAQEVTMTYRSIPRMMRQAKQASAAPATSIPDLQVKP